MKLPFLGGRQRKPSAMAKMIVKVVDYESGNLRSVSRALETAGAQPVLTSDPDALKSANAIVLPGVGSGRAAMEALEQRGLVRPLQEAVASGTPVLCICLGLQLLMDDTEEGSSPCLGIISGTTRKLPDSLKVPHMGWNSVSFRHEHPLLDGIPDGSYFYFVHSYYAEPFKNDVATGVTEYGLPFCSVLTQGNVMATQFHPEKSGDFGLKIYSNFVDYASVVWK